MPLLPANGRVGSFVLQSIVESVLSIDTRSFPVHAGNGIIGYQIYVGAEIRGDFGEGICLTQCVVDGIYEDEFQSDHSSFGVSVFFYGGEQRL